MTYIIKSVIANLPTLMNSKHWTVTQITFSENFKVNFNSNHRDVSFDNFINLKFEHSVYFLGESAEET